MQGAIDFLNQPRRVGGVCGVLFFILFIIAIPAFQSEAPIAGDSAEDIRAFWEDDADGYLVGDFLFTLGAGLFFLPFLLALKHVLTPADKSGGFWPQILVVSALFGILIGAGGAAAPAALGMVDAPDTLDDSTLLFATSITSYVLVGLGFGFALMLFSAALLILQCSALWRWLAYPALIISVGHIVGATWLMSGEIDGGIGPLAAISLGLTILWFFVVAINMLVRSGEPAA